MFLVVFVEDKYFRLFLKQFTSLNKENLKELKEKNCFVLIKSSIQAEKLTAFLSYAFLACRIIYKLNNTFFYI